MIWVAATIWSMGFALLMYGAAFYPLPHEHASVADFKRDERKARIKRYVGGALILLAFVIHWVFVS